jgi:L-lactate permease
MIVGWAFALMIEGSSGFGTPAAIAAPLLVGLGFAPVLVAILALIPLLAHGLVTGLLGLLFCLK